MKRETNREKNTFNVEYTNKDIMERIEDFRNESLTKINALIVQTTKTNGRVTKIEEEKDMIVNQFNQNHIGVCKRVDQVESDLKVLSWKVAGIAAAAGIIVSLVTLLLSKLLI